jgi:hypothetical protein
MHCYIFDYFLGQKKYERVVATIETRLTDLGLQGKNCHVGPLKSLRSIVRDELKNNPKTIVAIGNNATFSGLVNALEGAPITVGIIPVGQQNSLAERFGLADEDSACTALAARLIETIDLGVANGSHFVSEATITAPGTIIEINGAYTIEPTSQGMVSIVNAAINPRPGQTPRRGFLDVFIEGQKRGLLKTESDVSFIQTKQVIANNLHGKLFLLDETAELKPPAAFSVAKDALSVIVGRDRHF